MLHGIHHQLCGAAYLHHAEDDQSLRGDNVESTVKGIWNAITDVLDDIVNAIVLLLPDSPFKDVEIPAEVKQLFGYVNYFVPVTAMLAIGTTWLTAIGVYYLYQTILRWAKTIK